MNTPAHRRLCDGHVDRLDSLDGQWQEAETNRRLQAMHILAQAVGRSLALAAFTGLPQKQRVSKWDREDWIMSGKARGRAGYRYID